MDFLKVLILLDNPFLNDRRVYLEANSLVNNGFKVTIICTIDNHSKKFEIINKIKVKRILDPINFKLKNWMKLSSIAKKIIKEEKFDIIHSHDQEMLNLGVLINKNLKHKKILVYDSHELFHSWSLNLTNFERKIIMFKSLFVREIQKKRERKNIKKADHIITVNESLATNLKIFFKLKINPIIVRNIPNKRNTTKKIDLRLKFNIPTKNKTLVFLGANIYLNSLNIEQVFEEFKNLNDISIIIISINNINRMNVEKYTKEKKIKNIYFHDAVKFDDIPIYLSSFDVGLVPTWNKKVLSYWYALDNKIFDYLHSGIPILGTIQPEYKKVIEKYKIGVCVNPDIKNAYLNGFKTIINNKKKFVHPIKKAGEILTWENEQKKLINFYEEIKNKKI